MYLRSYENPLALEFRPGGDGGPYCCCDEAICASNISSAPSDCPVAACDLLFTVCVNVSEPIVNPTRLTGDCFQSTFRMDSLNNINFTGGLGAIFTTNLGVPVFTFVLDSSVFYQVSKPN